LKNQESKFLEKELQEKACIRRIYTACNDHDGDSTVKRSEDLQKRIYAGDPKIFTIRSENFKKNLTNGKSCGNFVDPARNQDSQSRIELGKMKSRFGDKQLMIKLQQDSIRNDWGESELVDRIFKGVKSNQNKDNMNWTQLRYGMIQRRIGMNENSVDESPAKS
jgi:hypothetical protein